LFFYRKGWQSRYFLFFGPLLQVAAALICLKIPDPCFHPCFFSIGHMIGKRAEAIYKNIFKVNRWKKLLPDGGAFIKGGYKKKSIENFTKIGLNKFLIESCRAEMTHWLAILPFWILDCLLRSKSYI